jgi:hypothetical protein
LHWRWLSQRNRLMLNLVGAEAQAPAQAVAAALLVVAAAAQVAGWAAVGSAAAQAVR